MTGGLNRSPPLVDPASIAEPASVVVDPESVPVLDPESELVGPPSDVVPGEPESTQRGLAGCLRQ